METLRPCPVKQTYFNNLIRFYLCWGLRTYQPLWVILCRLPEKGRKEIEEIHVHVVEEMKEKNREERGTRLKVMKQKHSPSPLPTTV